VFGPADGAAVLLAAVGLSSAALLLLHVWLTPLLVVSALAVPVLVFPGRAASTLRHLTRHVTARGLLVTGALMVPLAAIIGFAVYDAAAVDIVEVRNILDDPQSVHAPPDVQPN